ncbi:MAG: serine hydrolase [Myxococcota bacterium]
MLTDDNVITASTMPLLPWGTLSRWRRPYRCSTPCSLQRALVWAWLTVGVFAGAGYATPAFPEKTSIRALEDFIAAKMQEVPSAGLSVAFSVGDQTWAKGFGFRDLVARLPATPTTSYRMASVTKAFTAVAVLQLWEQGILDLDADIRRYVPYFPRKSHVVTPRHLLGHLSGIPHYKDCAVECFLKTHHTTKQAVAVFAGFPLEHAPGASYTYTSYGYNLLGAAVEEVSGEPYGKYLAENIFKPAGMPDAQLENRDAPSREQARGYRILKGKVLPSVEIDISSRFAGGGARATVLDMVSFGQSYLRGDLLAKESMRLVETSMATDDGLLTDYGMGFAVTPQSGRFVLAHGGGQSETSTLLVMHPASQVVIALAANIEDFHPVLHEVREYIVSLVLGDGGRRRIPTGVTVADAALARTMSGLMSHGIASFERWGPIEGAEQGPLLEAFRRLVPLLDPRSIALSPEDALRRARLGDDPIGGRTYPIAGRHMAAVINRYFGQDRLSKYQNDDVLGFLLDYASACDAFDCPPPFQLDTGLREHLRTLEPSWRRANSPAIRHLHPEDFDNVADLDSALHAAFAEAPVHPDLSAELIALADRRSRAGASETAAALRTLALRTHPQSPHALLAALEDATRRHDRAALRDHLPRWSLASEAPVEKQVEIIRAKSKALAREDIVAALHVIEAACHHWDTNPSMHDHLAELAEKHKDLPLALSARQRAHELAPTPLRKKRLWSTTNRMIRSSRAAAKP